MKTTEKNTKNGSFSNLIELMSFFSSQNTCKEYLEDVRWSGDRECPHCGHNKSYVLKQDFTYKCADCKKLFSVTKGTIFENSPIPLQKWFAAIYLITSHKKGISSLQLHRDLGITQKSAWFLLQRVRFAIRTKSYNMPLTGIVEIDESYIGGKNKNRHDNKKVESSQGRSTKDKTAILGMAERGGNIVALKIESASSKDILPHIFNNVAEDTHIMTDEWLGYKPLERYFPHSVVKHGQGQYVSGGCHTNTI